MKRLLLFIIAFAILTGCSKNAYHETLDGNDPVEIRLASPALEISTRKPFEGEISIDNKLASLVLTSSTESDYTTTLANGVMTFTGSDVVGYDTPAYYPADNSTVYLCGLYPATGWGSFGTTAQYTIDGKSDVMSAPQVSTIKSSAQTGSYPALAFSHLLTKLDIKVIAESETAASAWGNVTEITLTKALSESPATVVTVTLGSGTVQFSGSGSLNCWDDSDNAVLNHSLTTDVRNLCYVLCAPVIATGAKDYTLTIKTENRSAGTDVDLDLKTMEGVPFSGSTQGKAFEITLTFKDTNFSPAFAQTDRADEINVAVQINAQTSSIKHI